MWGGLLHLSPNSDGSLLIYQSLFTDVDSPHLWWYPMDLSINFPLVMKPFYFCHGVASNKCKPYGFNKCLELIMAIFWRDLTAHRWHWFILIYFFGSSMRYVPKIWLPSIVSNITVYGVRYVSYLNYLHLETGPTGTDGQVLFLTDWPCTWFR